MSEQAVQIDHRAKALELLGFANDERNSKPFQDRLRLEASIHAQLAIAEELKAFRELMGSSAT